MYAVEFETEINNGMVEIPAKYSKIKKISNHVKVIIMVDIQKDHHQADTNKSIFSSFLSMSKQVNSFNKI